MCHLSAVMSPACDVSPVTNAKATVTYHYLAKFLTLNSRTKQENMSCGNSLPSEKRKEIVFFKATK